MSWLRRFRWYRGWKGGIWHFDGRRWWQVTHERLPDDLSDDISLRVEIRAFLSQCETENQRERT